MEAEIDSLAPNPAGPDEYEKVTCLICPGGVLGPIWLSGAARNPIEYPKMACSICAQAIFGPIWFSAYLSGANLENVLECTYVMIVVAVVVVAYMYVW